MDDERIHPGCGDATELRFGSLHLAGENQGVHRDESFHAVAVEVFHEFDEVCLDEVVCTQASVEFWQAEVDGIRPGRDCSAGAVPVTRRGEELGSRIKCKRCHGGSEARKTGERQRRKQG